MPTPGEHKTVQARILAYAQELGWALVPREEAERRRGFDAAAQGGERARNASLFFEELLHTQVRRFNPLRLLFGLKPREQPQCPLPGSPVHPEGHSA